MFNPIQFNISQRKYNEIEETEETLRKPSLMNASIQGNQVDFYNNRQNGNLFLETSKEQEIRIKA